MVGKWLCLAVLAAPLVGHATPLSLPDPDVLLLPAKTAPMKTYAARPPSELNGRSAGWGLRATLHGRSMDLDAPDGGWTNDASVGARDMSAGYGWRGHGADAMIGFSQVDLGPHDNAADKVRFDAFRQHEDSASVLGLSLVLHGR